MAKPDQRTPQPKPVWPDPTGLPPDELYALGVSAFNLLDFYEAHDYWEELWTEYQLADRHFVQGLIQLAVGCFHLTNDNLNGGQGLLNKCRSKLGPGSGKSPGDARGLDVSAMLNFVDDALRQISSLQSAADFDWSRLPTLAAPPSQVSDHAP